jgi:hypothetical protein
MGKSITPTYRVEYRDNASRSTSSMCWRGKASKERLEQWRKDYNKSFNPGGVNYHVSQSLGIVVHISHAWLIHQRTNECVAETKMPMFELV